MLRLKVYRTRKSLFEYQYNYLYHSLPGEPVPVPEYSFWIVCRHVEAFVPISRAHDLLKQSPSSTSKPASGSRDISHSILSHYTCVYYSLYVAE